MFFLCPPIRMHAIVGIASSQQKLDSQTSSIFLTMSLACGVAIPPGGLDEIFGTSEHDLLVEAESQRATFGAFALSVSTFGPQSDAVIHTQIPNLFIGLAELESQAIAERVIVLLNGVLESEFFQFFQVPPGLP